MMKEIKDALSSDIDAFLWIAGELDRIWSVLIVNQDDPSEDVLAQLANDVFYVADESRDFAKQCQEDIETLEKKEAGEHEQDPVNT